MTIVSLSSRVLLKLQSSSCTHHDQFIFSPALLNIRPLTAHLQIPPATRMLACILVFQLHSLPILDGLQVLQGCHVKFVIADLLAISIPTSVRIKQPNRVACVASAIQLRIRLRLHRDSFANMKFRLLYFSISCAINLRSTHDWHCGR